MNERLQEIKDWMINYGNDRDRHVKIQISMVNSLIQTIEQQQERINHLEHLRGKKNEAISEMDAEIQGIKTLLEGEKDLRKATDELLQGSREEIERLKDALNEIVLEYQVGNADPARMFHLSKDVFR